jgi:hypothetical protein
MNSNPKIEKKIESKTNAACQVLCVICENPSHWPNPEKKGGYLTSPLLRIRTARYDGYVHDYCRVKL